MTRRNVRFGLLVGAATLGDMDFDVRPSVANLLHGSPENAA